MAELSEVNCQAKAIGYHLQKCHRSNKQELHMTFYILNLLKNNPESAQYEPQKPFYYGWLCLGPDTFFQVGYWAPFLILKGHNRDFTGTRP